MRWVREPTGKYFCGSTSTWHQLVVTALVRGMDVAEPKWVPMAPAEQTSKSKCVHTTLKVWPQASGMGMVTGSRVSPGWRMS